MTKIFISYRRGDTAGHAGRLSDRLKEDFGASNVFMDVNAIGPGRDFKQEIENAISTCDVVLVVMHRNWARSTDASGKPRLAMENDFVRLEVAAGLRRGVRVVPVLVERAELPRDEELGEDLRPLLRRQAFELRDERWDSDVRALSLALRGLSTDPGSNLLRRASIGGAIGVAALVAVGVGLQDREGCQTSEKSPDVATVPGPNAPSKALADAALAPASNAQTGRRGKHCSTRAGALTLFTFAGAQTGGFSPLTPPGTASVGLGEGGCADAKAMQISVPGQTGYDGDGVFVEFHDGSSWRDRSQLHLLVRVARPTQAFDKLEVFVKSNDYRCECTWFTSTQQLPVNDWYDLVLPLSKCPDHAPDECSWRSDDIDMLGIKLYGNAGPAALLVDQIWLQ
ncbi:MAG: hypothetical protein JWN04_6494 [Myxococcaceae bacterium]|nr:hypothetical protein [Myxococcaceae bacterium]